MAPVETGFWGSPTSTIDWCERNYEVTYYIAEFWNTISNLVMIIPPAWAAFLAWRDGIGFRFIVCHLFLLLVGIGSWSFHMTLLYEMQLFDELPMLYGASVLIYCLFGIMVPDINQRKKVACVLFSYSFLVTAIYMTINKPIFYQVAYGILVFFLFIMDLHLARTKKCDIRLYVAGAAMYLLGFLVWNIDNNFCQHLTTLRNEIPGPFAPFTQLHAWWHCLAGYATYLHILFCIHASVLNQKQKCVVTYDYLGLCVRKQPHQRTAKKANAHKN